VKVPPVQFSARILLLPSCTTRSGLGLYRALCNSVSSTSPRQLLIFGTFRSILQYQDTWRFVNHGLFFLLAYQKCLSLRVHHHLFWLGARPISLNPPYYDVEVSVGQFLIEAREHLFSYSVGYYTSHVITYSRKLTGIFHCRKRKHCL
jgi:hypothetical protein